MSNGAIALRQRFALHSPLLIQNLNPRLSDARAAYERPRSSHVSGLYPEQEQQLEGSVVSFHFVENTRLASMAHALLLSSVHNLTGCTAMGFERVRPLQRDSWCAKHTSDAALQTSASPS